MFVPSFHPPKGLQQGNPLTEGHRNALRALGATYSKVRHGDTASRVKLLDEGQESLLMPRRTKMVHSLLPPCILQLSQLCASPPAP